MDGRGRPPGEVDADVAVAIQREHRAGLVEPDGEHVAAERRIGVLAFAERGDELGPHDRDRAAASRPEPSSPGGDDGGPLRAPAHGVALEDRRRPVVGAEESQDGGLETPVLELGRQADPARAGAAGIDQLDGARHPRTACHATGRQVPAPESRTIGSVGDGVDERSRQPGRSDVPLRAGVAAGSRVRVEPRADGNRETMTVTTRATSERDLVVEGSSASAGLWTVGSAGGTGMRTGPLFRCSPLRGSAPQGGPLPHLPSLPTGASPARRGARRSSDTRFVRCPLPVASEAGAARHVGTLSGGAYGRTGWSGRRTSRRRVPLGSIGSATSSRRGMTTNARWCMRGWGTVSRGVIDGEVVDQQDVDVDGPGAPADVPGAAERRPRRG